MSDAYWTVSDDGLLRHDNHIYVPDANDLWLQVLQDKHDHVLSGHFGQGKTYDVVRHKYYWPNLWPFVVEFCKSCVMCKHSKAPRHQPYGYLTQPPIPERPWDSIEQLPSSVGFMAILVIVDRLLKQAVFIPTHDMITLAKLAKLFVLHVFSKHGVLNHITLD